MARQFAVAATLAWGSLCLLVPSLILSCGEWNASNKDTFRVAVGFCLCVNVAMLCWSAVNELARATRQTEAVVLVGPFRWAAPAGLFLFVVFDYFMLKLSHKVFQLRETPTVEPSPQEARNPAPTSAVQTVSPSGAKSTRKRTRKIP